MGKIALERVPGAMKRHLIAMLALATVGCSGGTPIDEGKWTTSVELKAGTALLWKSEGERCIAAPETEGPIANMLSLTPLGSCTAYESNYGGGSLSVRLACMGRPGGMIGAMSSSKVAVDGQYGTGSIDADFDAAMDGSAQPPLKGTLVARRTGDC